MKFQTIERLPDADPEAVLRVMEDGLREVSSELVREGHRITLAGLGPSPRVKNRRDRTVIDVKAENGVTTIQVDVTYQASAVLGNTSQNEVVQAKLDRVFDEMRMQLGLRRVREQAQEESPAITGQAETTPDVLPEIRFAAEASEVPGAQATTAEVLPVDPPVAPIEDVSPPQEEDLVEPEPVVDTPEQVEDLPEIAAEAALPVMPEVAEPVVESKEPETKAEVSVVAPAEEVEKVEVMAPVVAELPKKIIPEPPQKKTEPATPKFTGSLLGGSEPPEDAKGSRWWSAWAAAIVVLVVAPIAWLYLPQTSKNEPAAVQESPAAASAAAAPVAQPRPEQPAPPQPGAQEDPALVVQDWASAMGSNDAAKQAAFYADSLDRYFLRHNVSRESVLADKQASIDRRQDGWSVTMERVKVLQKNGAATATIQLIKHFVVRKEGKLTSQWFVPSQLQLKRVDGRWQITSERDMGWAPSLEELGY